MVPPQPHAQTDTVYVPSDGASQGSLNAAVQTAVIAGTLAKTVFALEPFGCYILTGPITVPAGEQLTVIAPEPGQVQHTAPPQIVFADTIETEPGKALASFDCYGDIVLKNIWLLYANTRGDQVGATLLIENSPDTVKGQVGTFEGVIFDYSSCPSNGSGAVGVTAKHFRGIFSNCYFRNCTDVHYRYYGRAVSFPYGSCGWHIDSLLFVNCTFANMGYVYMQEEGEYADNVHFNHCTFLNVVMFALESGFWYKLSVTNSVFVNSFMDGDIPVRRGAHDPHGGTLHIDSVSSFGFAVPFGESDRRILFTHSSYFIEDWLRDRMYNNPMSVQLRQSGDSDQVPIPQPMLSPGTLRFFDATEGGTKVFPFMNRAHLYDSTDPGFVLSPTNEIGIKTFLYMKWWCCSDTTWAYFPELSLQQIWPLKENLAYTNPALFTAAMGGYPLGDLYHWFPDQYSRWRSQEGSEEARITAYLNTGSDPGGTNETKAQPGNAVPLSFALSQNYPNPFNASTVISYQLPVESEVRIAVYDLLGREVTTLVKERKEPGAHHVTFDATRLASGVYLYQMRAGAYTLTRKMAVMK